MSSRFVLDTRLPGCGLCPDTRFGKAQYGTGDVEVGDLDDTELAGLKEVLTQGLEPELRVRVAD